jgi:ABC-type antimicrobial peptide transport system permease subunit
MDENHVQALREADTAAATSDTSTNYSLPAQQHTNVTSVHAGHSTTDEHYYSQHAAEVQSSGPESQPQSRVDHENAQNNPSIINVDTLDMRKPEELGNGWFVILLGWVWQYSYFCSHAKREACKRKFNFCLGVSSIFIVVLIAGVAYTMIARAPVVFLQQGEADGGQIDLMMRPSETAATPFLNYSRVTLNTDVAAQYSFHAPRTSFFANAYGADCNSFLKTTIEPSLGQQGLDGLDWRYAGPPGYESECSNGVDCLPKLCNARQPVAVRLIDTEREARMRLGRAWPYDRIPEGECLMSADMAFARQLQPGDTVWVGVLDSLTLPHMALQGLQTVDVTKNASIQLLDTMDKYSLYAVPLRIADVYSSSKGKFPSSQDENNIVMEYDTYYRHVLRHLNPKITNVTLSRDSGGTMDFHALLDRSNPLDFVSEVPMNLPPERVEVYIDSNYDNIQRRLVAFISQAMYYSSFPEIDVELDLLNSLFRIRFFTLYLGLILSVVLTILFILATMLIYSLLMISIETRTFELGVHRMVGMTRCGLVQMLLTQAISFALPAWIAGLLLAQFVVNSILTTLETSVEAPIDKSLAPTAVVVSTILGLLIPVISSLLPIRNALQQNLQDSLDTRHSKTMAVQISIERSEDTSISPAWVVLGAGMFSFGFLIYYLVPLSLLSFNLALFFNIFFGLLLGMLFGLILLSLNVQHLLESALVGLLLWWERRPIRTMVGKNLSAHRIRNRKTTMMFALALGFIIFITVSFQTELITAKFRILQSKGSYMKVESDDELEYSHARQMEQILLSDPAIRSFSWVSQQLDEAGDRDASWLTNLGHVQEASTNVWAVSPNFYDVTLSDDFLKPRVRDTSTGLLLSEQLYTPRGSQRALIASAFRDSHAITELNNDFLIVTRIEGNENIGTSTTGEILRLAPLAMLDLTPKFVMSRFASNGPAQDSVISFPFFATFGNETVSSVEDIRMNNLQLLFYDDVSDEDQDRVKLALTQIADTLPDTEIWDFRDFQESLDQTNSVMTLIFGVATYIAMGLCLFSLMASMYTNIYEQSKEIGILRALGFRSGQIVLIYVYEAFFIVLSASLLGLIIGTLMGWTILAQRILFTQLPVSVPFPTTMLILVVVGSVICAIIASFGPARSLVKKTVAAVMRTYV